MQLGRPTEAALVDCGGRAQRRHCFQAGACPKAPSSLRFAGAVQNRLRGRKSSRGSTLGKLDAGKPPVRFDAGRSQKVMGLRPSIRRFRAL